MAKEIKKYSKIALIIALSITMSVFFLQSPQVQAGALTEKQVAVSDSRVSDVVFYGASTTADYDFQADESAAVDITCIRVWFCTSASSPAWDGSGCTKPTGINFGDIDEGNVDAWSNLDPSSDWDIQSSTTKSVIASTTAASQQLGNDGSWVFGNVYNPSATGTYYTWIYTHNDVDCETLTLGGVVDSGISAFAVFQGVTVTAIVTESLDVTVTASSCVDFLEDSDTVTVSATTSINYGEITANEFEDSCQRIDIGTNASNGYIARIYKTQQLTKAGGEFIDDGNCDGSCGTTTEEAWQTATNNSGFGYCMKDKTYDAAIVADSGWDANKCGPTATQYFKTISNTTSSAAAIMQSGTATSTNQAWIGYRLVVGTAQGAGIYTSEIIYIVTPQY